VFLKIALTILSSTLSHSKVRFFRALPVSQEDFLRLLHAVAGMPFSCRKALSAVFWWNVAVAEGTFWAILIL
jgi:hypothetical protein